MKTTLAKTDTRERQHEAQPQAKGAAVREVAMAGTHPGLLNLQRSAGNHAVTNLLRAGTSVVQRKCASCHGGSEKCVDCAKETRLQRQAGNQAHSEPSTATAAVREGLASPTQSLAPTVRRSMESSFGQDFGHVRLHTDARAAQSAQQVNARAYTVGSDIVFGSGHYQPYTREGQHLLAHELTHTIQQGNSHGVAFDQIGISDATDASEREADAVAGAVVRGEAIAQRPATAAPQVSRQPATGKTATQPATQPAATGFTGCSPEHQKDLPADLSDAIDWVKEAITDLENKEGMPAHTKRALDRYLTTDSKQITSVILPKVKLILAEFQMGATNFRCQTEQQCVAQFPGGAVAYSGNPITLCPSYFDDGRIDRVTNLIHEAGHNAGMAGNVVEFQWPFPGLDEKTRLGNTESYAAFIRSNKYPSLALREFSIAPVLSTGGLFPGGGLSPRYVVRVEFDAVLSRRLFRFMDLHLGYGVDVDSKGSVLGSAYFGTRSFAPLSLTGVPVYLDLRAGGVIGGISQAGSQFKSTNVGLNVGGLSTDIGLGITSGRFGASVNYRHIFNFLNNNPNIDELVVSGEIRFF
jgi:hypothetical protein